MVPIVLALVISCLAVGWLARPGGALALDHPSERSLHSRPTPRTGGIGVWLGLMAAMPLLSVQLPPALWPAGVGALALATVSLLDDFLRVSAAWRLLAHLGVGVLALVAGLALEGAPLPLVPALPAWAAAPVTVVAVVWMINLYNFMDGMDGFAGGMAVIGFSTYALLALSHGHLPLTLMSAAVAASAVGFLVWNFPPARIFLGDAGSTLFGYLAGILALWADHDGVFPFWLGAVIFLPFVADATVTLTRRILRGEKIWLPHRSHYYQRLVLRGWGHRRTVLVEYGLMLICAATALAIRGAHAVVQAVALLALCAACALLMRRVDRMTSSS